MLYYKPLILSPNNIIYHMVDKSKYKKINFYFGFAKPYFSIKFLGSVSDGGKLYSISQYEEKKEIFNTKILFKSKKYCNYICEIYPLGCTVKSPLGYNIYEKNCVFDNGIFSNCDNIKYEQHQKIVLNWINKVVSPYFGNNQYILN